MKIKLFIETLISFVLITSVTATVEIPGIGTCPKVNIIRNFEVSRFFGRW
jgi:hypothetical protein